MRTAYKVLAYLVAAEVAVQAMVMVWAIAGLGKWVDGGGVFDKAVIESEGALPFPEIAGILVHGINGSFVIPGIALLLLIVSFFTKVRGAIKWAVVVFVLVIVQGQLGGLGHDIPSGRRAARPQRPGAVRRGHLHRSSAPRCGGSGGGRARAGTNRHAGVMIAHFGQPPTRQSAAATDRPADRGNRRHRGPIGLAVAGQPGAGRVLGDGHGLPRLRRRSCARSAAAAGTAATWRARCPATTSLRSPRLVTDMVADPARPADLRVDLVTRQQMLTVGGRSIPGFTVNGTSPGPEIRARQGQLIEVHLRNESVADGVTLHWHGVDVPNAMDGVAGVTQDAVPVGGEFTYRFVADQAGSYWYHSHQVSNPQVAGGLLGSLVVTPKSGIAQQVDVSAVAHTYGGVRTINGKAEDLRVPARPGQRVRVRVTNTDNGPMKVWTSGSYRLLAIDGTEVHQPTEVSDRSVTLTAGARADLEVKVPS